MPATTAAEMIRHGEHPFLECSSDGDRRFSAFFARIRGRGNDTIEEIYQGAKVFRNGDTGLPIDEAKGFRPANVKEVAELYSRSCGTNTFKRTRILLRVLLRYKGVSDRFGQRGHVCQATELWRIRNSWPVVVSG
jgi:hypothetical protein